MHRRTAYRQEVPRATAPFEDYGRIDSDQNGGVGRCAAHPGSASLATST